MVCSAPSNPIAMVYVPIPAVGVSVDVRTPSRSTSQRLTVPETAVSSSVTFTSVPPVKRAMMRAPGHANLGFAGSDTSRRPT